MLGSVEKRLQCCVVLQVFFNHSCQDYHGSKLHEYDGWVNALATDFKLWFDQLKFP